MRMKTCFKCGEDKLINCFYKHKAMGDGYLGKCKKCTKKDTIDNRLSKIDYYQAYDRERANLPHRVKLREMVWKRWKEDPKLRKISNIRSAKWRAKNTIKRSAHLLVQYAVRRGDMKKYSCEVCGKKKVEAHHDDYSKPLEVRWLCRKHHMDHHQILNEVSRIQKSVDVA